MPPPLAAPANGSPVPSIPDMLGAQEPRRDDPAWQPPLNPTAPEIRERAEIIHREIPLSVVVTGWDVPRARAARESLVIGLFEQPAQMVDSIILSDSRVQSGLAARLSILGRPVSFRIPKRYADSSAARECRDAFEEAWPSMATEPAMSELQRWAVMMGVGFAQNIWDFSGEYAVPHPLPWHPRYVYYHWLYRTYVAITLDGQEPIVPGDGSWIVHAPHGLYRGWMRGAVGAITPWWLGRAYALRDWMRYSERHGLPMIKLMAPAIGDPVQQSIIRFQLQHLGAESVFHLPQNPPPALSYDIDLMEAKDTAHEGFRMLIEQCNQEITLALLAQTLTTSMPAEGGSSYAAARVHAGVLQGLMEADARALALTIYRDVARAFAAVNFGLADLAPRVEWDVTPYEDALTKAKTFQAVAAAALGLLGAGWKAKDMGRVLKAFQLDVGGFESVEPLTIAAQAARASGQAEAEGAASEAGSEGGGKAEARMRVGRLMSRIDPRVGERARIAGARFVDGDDDALREAMAEIEAGQRRQRRRR